MGCTVFIHKCVHGAPRSSIWSFPPTPRVPLSNRKAQIRVAGVSMQLEMPGGECRASQARTKPHRCSQVTVSSEKRGRVTGVAQKQLNDTACPPAETTQGLYLANGTLETALGFCLM